MRCPSAGAKLHRSMQGGSHDDGHYDQASIMVNGLASLLLAGLLAFQATGGQAQEAIGSATAVKPQADDSQGRDTRTLSVGSMVFISGQHPHR